MFSLLESRGPLLTYSLARSFLYSTEGLLQPFLELVVNRSRPRLPVDDPELFRAARGALYELLKRDVENIQAGFYPVQVLKPESPLRHIARFPLMLREGVEIMRRRRHRSSHEFSQEADELLSELPEYYKRNFHFQGDGYLSEKSARLYEHQVEILFAGAADAMRRLILPPLRKRFGAGSGEGLTFLELGAGTGRSTRFVRLAFPKAKIVAVDLSSPYLKKAQASLKAFARHDYLEADAAKLPFLPESFDAVYSVFLFHELPQKERKAVVQEALRVLKPGGFIGIVDSLQIGDESTFDRALEQFPIQFHEPFYKNYIHHPLEDLLIESGARAVEKTTGFFSKAVSAVSGA